MTDDYEIPTGDTGHEPGTFLMVLTALKPWKLYETRNGWAREAPTDGSLIQVYDKIEWVFADDQGETGSDSTSVARGESSTLFKWATGLGVPPAVVLDRSKPIPSSQLIGREGLVTFMPNKNGYSRITSVVPAPKARTAPVQPPVANTEAVSQPGGPIREIVPPQPEQPMTAPPNMVAPDAAFGQAGPQPTAEVPATDPLTTPGESLPF